MSYILDALRRAEHDRRNAQSSPIEQVAIAPPPLAAPPSRRRGIIVSAFVLVLIAAVAAIAYGLWLHVRREATPPVARQLPVLIPAGQPIPQPAGKERTTPAPQTVRATPPPAADLPNPIADADRLSSIKDLMPPKPKPRVIHHPRVKAAPQTAAATTPASNLAAVTTAAGTPIAPAPATPNAAPAVNPALKTMPDSYRASFPQITVQVHVYDSDPAKCWVLIDGKRYKTGDTLPQGPKIYKIVPQGIVFDWQGQRVLYPLAN